MLITNLWINSAEIDRREGYEVGLLAALMACTRPLKR